MTPDEFRISPWPPDEHLWFLRALFLCQSLLIMLYEPFSAQLPAIPMRWAFGVVAIGLVVLSPHMPVPSLIWAPMVEHMPYILAGIAVAGLPVVRPNALAGAILGLFLVAAIATVGLEKASGIKPLFIVLAGWQIRLAPDRNGDAVGPGLRGLQYLGQAPMVIYLTIPCSRRRYRFSS